MLGEIVQYTMSSCERRECVDERFWTGIVVEESSIINGNKVKIRFNNGILREAYVNDIELTY